MTDSRYDENPIIWQPVMLVLSTCVDTALLIDTVF